MNAAVEIPSELRNKRHEKIIKEKKCPMTKSLCSSTKVFYVFALSLTIARRSLECHPQSFSSFFFFSIRKERRRESMEEKKLQNVNEVNGADYFL